MGIEMDVSTPDSLADESSWGEWARRLDGRGLPGYEDDLIPSPTDELVEHFLEGYLTLSPEDRARLVATLIQQDSATLCIFAERSASLAVRRSDEGRLRQALVAAGIAYAFDDYRDVLPTIAACRDAAERVGSKLEDIVGTIASTVNPKSLEALVVFAKRSPADAELWKMGVEATFPPDGFRYRHISIDEVLARMASES